MSKYSWLIFIIILGLNNIVYAQVGIGILQPDSTAILHLESTSPPRGFLPPRLTTIQRDAILQPAIGLTIYNATDDVIQYFNGDCWLNVYQENCTDCHFAMALSDSSGYIDRTVTDSVSTEIILHQIAGSQPQPIGLSIYGNLPIGITPIFYNNPIQSNGTSLVSFKVTPFTPAGTFLIAIQALCGPSIRTIMYELTIEPCYILNINNATNRFNVSDSLYIAYPNAPTNTPICVTVTVGGGVPVTSTDPAEPAFTTGNLPTNSLVGVINNGLIIGRGGDGGDAWAPFNNPPLTGAGENGGHSMSLTCKTAVLNNGYIFGGGGGGNAMAFRICTPDLPLGLDPICFGIGSGGGGGAGVSNGGDAGAVITYYTPGGDGTGGIFGAPGNGGVLNSPFSFGAGPVTITINPNTIGGNGGVYGAPGTIGTFNVTVSATINLGITLTVGPWDIPMPVNPPPAGLAGYAVKRNNNILIGIDDNLNYQTTFIKGQVGN